VQVRLVSKHLETILSLLEVVQITLDLIRVF